jgi:hypothetical protein
MEDKLVKHCHASDSRIIQRVLNEMMFLLSRVDKQRASDLLTDYLWTLKN